MMCVKTGSLRAALATAALVCSSNALQAQSLFATQGTVVAITGDLVPDGSGIPLAGLTLGSPTGTAVFDQAVLDEAGGVLFRARFVDSAGPLAAFEDRAYFYGSSPQTLRQIARGGDPAPGQAAGVTLGIPTGFGSPLSSKPRLTPDGQIFFGATIGDGGVTITSSNSAAIFGGPVLGPLGTLVQRADIAPGTAGATFAQAFDSPSAATSGMNRNGHIFFSGALVTGTGIPAVTTATGSNNQVGLFAGLPGALELVARKSGPVSGIPGAIAIDSFTTLSSLLQMNSSNELLYDLLLSTSQGTPAATMVDDRALMVYSAATNSSTKLVREGDVAPVPGGGTFNAITGDNWAPGVADNAWTTDSEVIFVSELRGTVGGMGVDDSGVFIADTGGVSLVVQQGAAAPGTNGVFESFSSDNCLHNSAGMVVIAATLAGGTVTVADDSGIWAGLPGALQLVAREGQVMPGTGGSTCGSLSGQRISFNNRSQVVFRCNLIGTVTGSNLFTWDPVFGLSPVAVLGDMIEVAPGVFKAISAIGDAGGFSNTNGANLFFSHDSRLVARITFADNTEAIMTVVIPSSNIPSSLCNGDGGDQMGCTDCPCGNNSLTSTNGGCLNSAGTSARLDVSGNASVSLPPMLSSDLRFALTGLPPTAFTVLVSGDLALPSNMQNPCFGLGSGTQVANLDGLRCTDGNVLHHGGRSADSQGNVGLTNSAWGGGSNPPAGLAIAGGVGGFAAGQTRYFQAIHREDPTAVCGRGLNSSQAICVTFEP